MTERKPWRKARRRAPVTQTQEMGRNSGRRGEEKERGDHSIKRGERENVNRLHVRRTVKKEISPKIQKLRKVFESDDISTVQDFSVSPNIQKLRAAFESEHIPTVRDFSNENRIKGGGENKEGTTL